MLLALELRALHALPAVPAHLQDVPACLHKYEPLLREPPAAAKREGAPRGESARG